MALVSVALAVMPLTAHAASVDQRLRRMLRDNQVNGIVLVNGTAGRAHVISHREVTDRKQMVRANRLFPVASFQKLMTGVTVEQLVQSGKLSLNTPLSRFFPQIPLADQVTIDRMMKHTSGLVNQPRPLKRPLRGERAQLRYALTGCRSTGDFTWHYTDLDFILLAAVIQQTTHQAYRSYLSHQVLQPAGVHVCFYDQVKRSAVTGRTSTWQCHPNLAPGIFFVRPRTTGIFITGSYSTTRPCWIVSSHIKGSRALKPTLVARTSSRRTYT